MLWFLIYSHYVNFDLWFLIYSHYININLWFLIYSHYININQKSYGCVFFFFLFNFYDFIKWVDYFFLCHKMMESILLLIVFCCWFCFFFFFSFFAYFLNIFPKDRNLVFTPCVNIFFLNNLLNRIEMRTYLTLKNVNCQLLLYLSIYKCPFLSVKYISKASR